MSDFVRGSNGEEERWDGAKEEAVYKAAMVLKQIAEKSRVKVRMWRRDESIEPPSLQRRVSLFQV